MNNIDKLYELLKDEPIHEHASVLAYESGNVLEHAMYLIWAERHSGDVRIIRGKLKSELMDVMAQAWTLCVKMDENPQEWLELGCEKAIDAITAKTSGNLDSHVADKW